MKKYFLPLLLAVVLFSACGNTNDQSSPQMTQPIVSGDVVQPEGASQTPAPAQEQAPATPVLEDTLENYYRAKAEKEAYDAEIDSLEADFRVGKLNQETFLQQKSALEEQENAWEWEEDRLEYLRPHFDPAELSIDISNPSALLQAMQAAELAEEQAESQQEQLEMQYASGSLSREEFVQQYTALLKEEDSAESQADWLEEQLELLGYDD